MFNDITLPDEIFKLHVGEEMIIYVFLFTLLWKTRGRRDKPGSARETLGELARDGGRAAPNRAADDDNLAIGKKRHYIRHLLWLDSRGLDTGSSLRRGL